MSEQTLNNPAILGPVDGDGNPYYLLATDEGGVERVVCHECAVNEFNAGNRVACIGRIDWDDPAMPSLCELCALPLTMCASFDAILRSYRTGGVPDR